MIKTVVADTHALFRFGVKAALEKYHPDICVTGEAETGAELFELLKKRSPDVVLLDVNLPDIAGVKVVAHLKAEKPQIKVLVISSEISDFLVEMLIDAGISGFISKHKCSIDVLADAIRSVKNGFEYFSADISNVIRRIYLQKQRIEELPEITEQEKTIIKLCCNKLTSKQIAEQLNISFRTVETHKNNIFKKLEVKNTKEMVGCAMEKGIIRV